MTTPAKVYKLWNLEVWHGSRLYRTIYLNAHYAVCVQSKNSMLYSGKDGIRVSIVPAN